MPVFEPVFAVHGPVRDPTSLELDQGFPCGELSLELFNGLFQDIQQAINAIDLRNGNADIPVNGWMATPPASPAVGARYVVAPSPTGLWAGQATKIAVWAGTSWIFFPPTTGMMANYAWLGQFQPIWFDGTKWDYALIILSPVTRTVFGAGADFSSLAAAIEWALQYRIGKNGSVKFVTAVGQFTVNGSANSIDFDHPDASRISMESAGTPVFPSFASLAKNGFATGTRAADAVTNIAVLRAAFKTEIRLTGGAKYSQYGNFGGMSGILWSGDGTTNIDGPAFIGGRTTISNCAFHGFGARGLVAALCNLGLNNVIVSYNGTQGVYGDAGAQVIINGSVFAVGNGAEGFAMYNGSSAQGNTGGLFASSNAQSGVLANGASVTLPSGSTCSNNGYCGGRAAAKGRLMVIGCFFSSNASQGLEAELDSFIDAAGAGGNSNFIGALAGRGSTINAIGATIVGTSSNYSPAANTVGNSNSTIIA